MLFINYTSGFYMLAFHLGIPMHMNTILLINYTSGFDMLAFHLGMPMHMNTIYSFVELAEASNSLAGNR